MSMEKLVERIAEGLDRRSFLGKMGFGLVAGVLGLFALPERSEAVNYVCCHLCKSNSGSCSNCACVWCWSCGPWGPRGDFYQCCECFSSTSTCGGDSCLNVTCSYGRLIGH